VNKRRLQTNIKALFKIDNETLKKSINFLKRDKIGKEYFSLFSLVMHLGLAATPAESTDLENDKTIKFIGSRIVNDGIVGFREALSGYYSSSIMVQRDLIEIQFLLDYFRTNPEKIDEWKLCKNSERYNKFGPQILYKLLDKRDGFTGETRKSTYQQFSELAGHVSYPGFKLQANEKNDIMVAGFYDEKKILNTVIELNRRLGHAVVTLYSFLTIKNINLYELYIETMSIYGKLYKFEVNQNEQFKKAKIEISKLRRE
jgi:hypothetical protein